MRRGLLAGFIICVGIITYHDVKQCRDLPWPPRIIGTGIVFGLLGALQLFSEELAGVMAIGFTLATAVNNGFVADCIHNCEVSAQPNSFKVITGGPVEQQPVGSVSA